MLPAVAILYTSNPFRLPQNTIVHGFLILFKSDRDGIVDLSCHKDICIWTALHAYIFTMEITFTRAFHGPPVRVLIRTVPHAVDVVSDFFISFFSSNWFCYLNS